VAALAPRKSLPLSFPNLSQIQNSPDDSDTSPSDRTLAYRRMYGDVGKGRPSALPSRGGGSSHTPDTTAQLLMRRSSSGAFSSSSSEGSMLGTPTKLAVPRTYLVLRLSSGSFVHAPEWQLTGRPSPAGQAVAGVTSMKRPTFNRPNTYELGYRLSPRRSFNVLPRPPTEHERPNKFEVDFITVDTLGTGEFGSVLKARYRQGKEHDVFAIKKSKRFEGVKHRYVSVYHWARDGHG
jgi:mitosis inhibitor protein kinase SWE1